MHTYAIKYTTHRMRGWKLHFGEGRVVDTVIAKLRRLEEGVRVLSFSRRPVL